MAKLIELLEADLKDKVTKRAKITFEDLLKALYEEVGDKKIADYNLKNVAKKLKMNLTTLKKYFQQAKEEGFITKTNTIAKKYIKKIQADVKKDGTANNKEDEGNADVTTAKNGPKAKTGKISKIDKGQLKKFVAPKGTNGKFDKILGFILREMVNSINGEKKFILLAGDPGVGKTSFVKQLSKLLGLPLFVIEAPHITEEHIINIPYIVEVGNKKIEKSAEIEFKGDVKQGEKGLEFGDNFDIVQAESHLVTQLKKAKGLKLKGEQYLNQLKKDKNLYSAVKKYANLIKKIRDSYNSILFLDEYFRTDNIKIKNVLRNILNGRIGNDKIPEGVYILFASNIDDEGVDEIPLNQDFAEIEFDKPTKDEWFSYFKKKFIDNEEMAKRVNIKPEVFNTFYEILNDDDMANDDKETEVRISPRRWEQLLLFVNSSLPVKDENEARTLLANVKTNFQNYLNGKTSPLLDKVMAAVKKMIKETSGIDATKLQPLSPTQWKDILKQQLEVKIKLDGQSKDDDLRKYVPVVSGAPGIGKTSYLEQVANDLGLGFIHIDVSTLEREASIGLPKAKFKTDKNGNVITDKEGKPIISTEFTKPPLLELIKRIMEEVDAQRKELEKEGKLGTTTGKYRYVLMFDELTRTTPEVFNAIRKLMLEKEFNEQYKLPDDVMVVSALNPVDDGAEELTKHMRDVLDIIDSRPSWEETENYILSNEYPPKLKETLGFDLNKAVLNATKIVLNKYKTQAGQEDIFGRKILPEEVYFNLTDGDTIFYISPREITKLIRSVNGQILNKLTLEGVGPLANAKNAGNVDENEDENIDNELSILVDDTKNVEISVEEALNKGIYRFEYIREYEDADFEKFMATMLDLFKEGFEKTLNFLATKEKFGKSIIGDILAFIHNSDEIWNQWAVIKEAKPEDVKSLSELLTEYLDKGKIDELLNGTAIDNYIDTNLKNPTEFTADLTGYVRRKVDEIITQYSNKTEKMESKDGDEVEIPLDGYYGMKLHNDILKVEKTIAEILEDYEGSLSGQFYFQLGATIKANADEIYERIPNVIVPYVLLPENESELSKSEKIADELISLFNKIHIDLTSLKK